MTASIDRGHVVPAGSSPGSAGSSLCPPAAACSRPPTHRPYRGRQPWWAPPQRLDARAAHVLGLLAAGQVIAGLLQRRLQPDHGVRGGRVRCQRGRAGCRRLDRPARHRLQRRPPGAGRPRRPPPDPGRLRHWWHRSARRLGALAPSLAALTAIQTVARPLSLALALVITIVAAEEMPPGSRAYAVSLLGLAYALGAGTVRLGAARWPTSGTQGWRLVLRGRAHLPAGGPQPGPGGAGESPVPAPPRRTRRRCPRGASSCSPRPPSSTTSSSRRRRSTRTGT